jgi:hypothetical protein
MSRLTLPAFFAIEHVLIFKDHVAYLSMLPVATENAVYGKNHKFSTILLGWPMNPHRPGMHPHRD